jgi:hypothetical protein
MKWFVIPKPINRQRPFAIPHASGIAYTAERELAALDRYEALNLTALLGAGDPVPETEVDVVIGGPAAPARPPALEPELPALEPELPPVVLRTTADTFGQSPRHQPAILAVLEAIERRLDVIERAVLEKSAAQAAIEERRKRWREQKAEYRRKRALQKYNTARV